MRNIALQAESGASNKRFQPLHNITCPAIFGLNSLSSLQTEFCVGINMQTGIKHACLICAMLLMALTAFAHRPHEEKAGTFLRSDGTEISIVRYYVDGIVAADPVSIQFHLPDGTEIAHTQRAPDALVRRVRDGLEIYQFPHNWLPAAERVDFFDGYKLKDITAGRRLFSLLVHLAEHRAGYLAALVIAIFFMILWSTRENASKRRWRVVLRRTAYVLIALYAYCILMYSPLSPLVIAVLFMVFVGGYSLMRKRKPRQL
ncbi:MAG: hypothetical protein ACYC4Q_03675 [Victivallaceae bacterium]